VTQFLSRKGETQEANFKRTCWTNVLLIGLPAIILYPQAGSRTSAASPINKSPVGIALKGYDVVAYFAENKPVNGNKEFEYEWTDAKSQFSSAAKCDLFAKDPGKYAPQYGHQCAFGVSEGHKAPVDPNVCKIVDGRLYLNYDESV